MNCKICGEKLTVMGGYDGMVSMTAVGYCSPEGHNYDDNCVKRGYTCKNGHDITISKRRRCPNPDCDWVGNETCFCHPDKKVDEWPL